MHLNVGDLHPKSICDVWPLRKYSTLYFLTNNSEVSTNASAMLTFIDLSWPNENFGRSSENVLRTKASGDVWSPGHIPKKGNPLDLLRCQTINTLQLKDLAKTVPTCKCSCSMFFPVLWAKCFGSQVIWVRCTVCLIWCLLPCASGKNTPKRLKLFKEAEKKRD